MSEAIVPNLTSHQRNEEHAFLGNYKDEDFVHFLPLSANQYELENSTVSLIMKLKEEVFTIVPK